MVYNLGQNGLISSKDGSIANLQPEFDRWTIVDYFFILPEAGEFYYEGSKYEIKEPSIVLKTYKVEEDKTPEIFIKPAANAISRLIELKEIRESNRKHRNLCKEEVCCDSCSPGC